VPKFPAFLLGIALVGATAGAHAHENEQPTVLTVSGERQEPTSSSGEVHHRDLSLRVRRRPGELLSVVPGLFVVQHAGGGKANQYFLRGFDADHGTDVAVFVDGVPINMPTHGHGQGWVDLEFVIPELVQTVAYRKGPYAVNYGDFATAGAVDLRLTDHRHESRVLASGGNFGSARSVFMVSPELGDDWSTIVAGEASTTNGPFHSPERFRKLNAFGRATRNFARGALSLTWMSYAGGWNASGQIPLRAVGKVPELPDAFGAIDPTEGGSTQRHQLSLNYSHRHDDDEARALAYAIRYSFMLFSNFTFFANDPINGDQIAQSDDRTVLGTRWHYRHVRRVAGMESATTIGWEARHDSIDNGLFATRAREVLSTTSTASVAQTSVGLFAEEELRLLPFLRVIGGVRLDRYDVHANIATTSAMMASPKVSFVLSPARFVELFLGYGRGFHSNDARLATTSRDVSLLAVADGYETGVRARPHDAVQLSATVFRMDLASETVWVSDEGTTEPRGASRRIGVELGARVKLAKWIFADADVTFTRARFNSGEAIPLAPTRTLTGGIGFKHPRGTFGALRVRSLGARPATEDRSLTAEGWTVVDATLGQRIQWLEIALDVRNVLNRNYREVQFANESRLQGEPSPVRDIHFTPGWPLTVLLRASANF